MTLLDILSLLPLLCCMLNKIISTLLGILTDPTHPVGSGECPLRLPNVGSTQVFVEQCRFQIFFFKGDNQS